MKPAILVLTTAIAAHAAGVTLCLSKRTLTDNFTVLRAQAIVTRVFADAGVRVEWLSERQCKTAPDGALYVLLERVAPPQFGPSTLGYALPYSTGTAVHVFYGRIREDHPVHSDYVLGHTMAHEICHVLQGLVRHSESGIMKAQWNTQEYVAMQFRQLRFAPEDIELIQLGLKNQDARSLAARF